jgi:hypothetical protein
VLVRNHGGPDRPISALILACLDVFGSGCSALGNPGVNAPGPAPCDRYLEHRPAPSVDGSLHVDPDIRLPSPGMDVVVEFHYYSASAYNGPYGYRRSISPNQPAQADRQEPRVAQVTWRYRCLPGKGRLHVYVP